MFVRLIGMRQSQDEEKNPKRNGCCKVGHVFPKVGAFVGFKRRHSQRGIEQERSKVVTMLQMMAL